jgi:hypothetical protein
MSKITDDLAEKYVAFQAENLLEMCWEEIKNSENPKEMLIDLILAIEKEASVFRKKHQIAEINKN